METMNLNLNQQVKPVFTLLRFTLGVVPIVAGLDKFTNLLTNWEQYIHPGLLEVMPFSANTFMMIIGIIEIIAGIIVLVKPLVGGYIVAVWLAIIGLTLLASCHYVDVAVRDFVMAISAFCLARLAKFFA